MTPETAETIAETLSNRAIEEGRIVSFTANSTNAPPKLASLPKSTSTPGKNWSEHGIFNGLELLQAAINGPPRSFI